MAVINQDRASIIYQATTVLLDKTLAAVRTRSRKDRKQLYGEAAKIRYYLVALTFYPTYFDAEQANQILQCLVVASGIQDYPVPPVTALPSNPANTVLLKGDQGDIGPRGNDGGATDFAVTNVNGTTVLDSFLIGSSYGARWDYSISSLTSTIRRSGTVYGTWLADGSLVDQSEVGTSDVGGVSIGVVTLSVDYSSGAIRLNVGVSSGLWEIRGSRYLIPNQGVGVNVSSTPLPSANLFIGNASSVATAQAVTGDISITNGGVTAISAGVIVNADINASAAIATTKLAALANNNAVTLTNGSGFLTSIANGTSGYVLTSNGASAPSWQLVGGTGTVTSINASGGTTGLSFTGGPVATSGTLTVTGTLSYANGGTNQTFYSTGDFIYASAANTLSKLPIGAVNTVIKSDGSTLSWQPALTGAASTAANADFGSLKIVVTDASGKFVESLQPISTLLPTLTPLSGAENTVVSENLIAETLISEQIINMAQTLKTITQSGSGSATFVTGSKGSRIYYLMMNGTSSANTKLSITPSGGDKTAIISNTGFGNTNKNFINITDMPGIPKEVGSDIYFLPVGATTTVEIETGTAGTEMVVTYIDLT